MDAAAPPVTITQPSDAGRPAVPWTGADESSRPAHAVDVGIASFFRSGVASGGVVGLSPFVTDELGREVFLRMAAAIGQPTESGLHMTWVAGRLDTCSETLGNYAPGSGIRLDLCGGASVGAAFIGTSAASPAQSVPLIDLGPSVDLRAEIGPHAALLLRGAFGLAIARDQFVDQTGATYEVPLANVDLQVALSWTLSSAAPDAPLTASMRQP
ncbi:MAG TPA: hypothetical protein VK762_37990 [Polyangiaceae bacterium]|jgi:hypothetical protein|nr:hypothetical protein [Polyangiaceae bacterium]